MRASPSLFIVVFLICVFSDAWLSANSSDPGKPKSTYPEGIATCCAVEELANQRAEPNALISTEKLKRIANTASHAGGFKLPAKWPNITNAQADSLLVEMEGFVLEKERIALEKEVLRGVSGKWQDADANPVEAEDSAPSSYNFGNALVVVLIVALLLA